jgi:sec-independent protein translocase protein TatA
MPFGLHPGFLVVLMVVVLVVFGPGKLPELGSAAGNAIREFRKTTSAIADEPGSATGEEKRAG